MRFWGIFSVTLWLTTSASLPTNAAVFGDDNRVPLAPNQTHMNQQIGTLIAGNAGPVCTAFCVAPDMIATASHCLFGTERGASNRLQSIRFKRSSESEGEATPIAGASTRNQAQHVIAGTHKLRVIPPIGADQDWAIARLDRASCDVGGLTLIDAAGTPRLVTSTPDQTIFNIAVHRDKPDMALRHSGNCARQESFENVSPEDLGRDFSNLTGLIFHDCDTGSGSSGSPLMAKTPTGAAVIGINVGTYIVKRQLVKAGSHDDNQPNQAIANTAVMTEIFVPAISQLANRELLETEVDVRELQQRLQVRNLYTGRINGHVTPDLISAISKFERESGEPETGLVSRHVLALLRQDAINKRAEN